MRKLFSFILFSGLFFWSCDDGNENIVKPVPDAGALRFFVDGNVLENTQYFTIDGSAGGSVYCDEGTVIQFAPESFTDSEGNIVTGEVNIKVIEIFNRSAMVLMQKPTMGRTATGGLTALKSGGQFYVSATKKLGSDTRGPELSLEKEYVIIAPVSNTGEADDNMRLFTGVEECNDARCNVIWEEQPGDRNVAIDGFQDAGGGYTAYYAFQNRFGWTNIDRWYNDPRPKTTVTVRVPEGYNNANCAVYMAYKGDAALALFDRYDEGTKLFSEHYGLVPVGLDVHFILVSIIDDQVHYVVQSATITEDHQQVMKSTDVKAISEAALIDLIDALP